MNQWTLPDYVEDMLPDEAVYLESLRRSILDLYQAHGYFYVIPPMLEYIESLNSNGQDMDLDTFKVVDQLSGRLMGFVLISHLKWLASMHILFKMTK